MRRENPKGRDILLTVYETDEEILRRLRAGAASKLPTDVDSVRLIENFREVHTGRTSIFSESSATLADHVAPISLAPRQMDVLQPLAQGSPTKRSPKSSASPRGL